MTSTKPYLLRAIYEWCVDQGLTPYITVVVDPWTRVPQQFVKNGQIVLNLGVDAVHQLSMGNEEITFQARFSGAAFPVVVPVNTVIAIFARENGQGMAFEVEPSTRSQLSEHQADESNASDNVSDNGDTLNPEPSGNRPRLVRIK